MTAPKSRKLKSAPIAAGLQRAIEKIVLRMAGPRRKSYASPAAWR